MPNTPLLVLMCGLSFAGKTTIARALAAHHGWRYLSLDAINTERGVGLAEPEADQGGDVDALHDAQTAGRDGDDREDVGETEGDDERVDVDFRQFAPKQRFELRRIIPMFLKYLERQPLRQPKHRLGIDLKTEILSQQLIGRFFPIVLILIQKFMDKLCLSF